MVSAPGCSPSPWRIQICRNGWKVVHLLAEPVMSNGDPLTTYAPQGPEPGDGESLEA